MLPAIQYRKFNLTFPSSKMCVQKHTPTHTTPTRHPYMHPLNPPASSPVYHGQACRYLMHCQGAGLPYKMSSWSATRRVALAAVEEHWHPRDPARALLPNRQHPAMSALQRQQTRKKQHRRQPTANSRSRPRQKNSAARNLPLTQRLEPLLPHSPKCPALVGDRHPNLLIGCSIEPTSSPAGC